MSENRGDLIRHGGGVDEHGADPVNGERQAAHRRLDRGHEEHHRAVAHELVVGERVVHRIEAVLLVALGVVRAHDREAGEVLARDAVEVVGEALHAAEPRCRDDEADRHHGEEHHDGDGRGSRPLPALAGDLGDRPHRRDGGLDEHLQAQDDERLDLHHIVRGARDETRRGEPANLLHGERLHLAEQLGAHGPAEPGCDTRCAHGRGDRGEQAAERAGKHLAACREDLGHGRALDLHEAGDLGHVLRGLEVQPHLGDDERQRQDGKPPFLLR